MKKRQKLLKPQLFIPPLRVADFVCSCCHVQPTCNDDHICGICKALGQSAEPDRRKAPKRGNNLTARFTKPIVHWLEEHHLIAPGEPEAIILKEK